jgi:hypothetical protein
MTSDIEKSIELLKSHGYCIYKWEPVKNCPKKVLVDLWIVADSLIIDRYCKSSIYIDAMREQGRTVGWTLCSDNKFRNRYGTGETLSYKVTPVYFMIVESPPQIK